MGFVCFMAHMRLSWDNLAEVGSLPSCGCQGSNLGGQAWWHVPLQYGAISLGLIEFFLFKSLNLWYSFGFLLKKSTKNNLYLVGLSVTLILITFEK